MPSSLLNMPRKIRFEILIFPRGAARRAVSSSPSSSSASTSSSARHSPSSLFLFPRQAPRTREKIRSCPRLNTCVSIVKVADMANLIVLNFYVMYRPLAELSFSSAPVLSDVFFSLRPIFSRSFRSGLLTFEVLAEALNPVVAGRACFSLLFFSLRIFGCRRSKIG